MSSDLRLEPISGPISAPSGSILDMVEDAAEEMLDTVPGTSRRLLEEDAQRTAEMDQDQLAKLLPKTKPSKPSDSETVAMRPEPRTDPNTEPGMPVQSDDIEVERLVHHLEPEGPSFGLKLVVVMLGLAAAASVLWLFV